MVSDPLILVTMGDGMRRIMILAFGFGRILKEMFLELQLSQPAQKHAVWLPLHTGDVASYILVSHETSMYMCTG